VAGAILRWDRCLNVRELGGHRLPGRRTTRRRSIVRADDLARLSEDGRARLLEYGVTTIVDLRGEPERALHPPPFADGPVRYLHRPILAPKDFERGSELAQSRSTFDAYKFMLGRRAASVGAALAAIAAAEDGCVLVHCHVGKDRTGLVVAILLALAGVDADAIVEDYALSEGHLAELVEELVRDLDPKAAARQRLLHASPPEAMSETLEWLEAFGGVEAYVASAGLSSGETERLRRRLLP
jgi:protein-tyrosine phosphatase